ncbi:hypothetical protein ANACOL_00815 [Anaerotruncus colihominis DSM 17241]|uniref:Uncharacterized protein n=1 Tax=Anaerotruncus colihominis DSM 17241 TaxID=445972 RepID=B0P7S6_9FIRM|nr:hypothetical protein ANACOL_00815 [Anaerotruncus colihominis DSM 17241]
MFTVFCHSNTETANICHFVQSQKILLYILTFFGKCSLIKM